MSPIFSGSPGLHVFLVDHQVLEVRGGVEVDYEGVGVGAAGGVLAVDGLHVNRHFRYDSTCSLWLFYSLAGFFPTPLRIV